MANPKVVADSSVVTHAARTPPYSEEAEQALLGGLLLNAEAWDRIAEKITAEDFYRNDHRLIFNAIAQLSEQGIPVDAVTLAEWLDQREQLQTAGGLNYVGMLANETPSAVNIDAYALIVRERSILRQMIAVAQDIADLAYEPAGQPAAQLLDTAEAKVFAIAEQNKRNLQGLLSIRQILSPTLERIDQLFQSGNLVTGLETGFKDLDEKTSGLQPADLVVVAGRPSMGKTSFAMNLIEHAAINQQQSVAFFSMEMPAEQIVMRLLSSLSRVGLQQIRTGRLNESDWPRLTSTAAILSQNVKLFIDDSAGLSPIELRARARRIKREHGLGLIVVDYLQLMQVPGSAENRATEISEISRSLKALAKELNVPVVALSQLNRSLEQRTDRRPVMSDLRESGAIEQDADVILFIYRDEVYNEDSQDKGTAEILLRKQRNGPIGMVRLTFLGEFVKFENYVPDVYSGIPLQ